MPSSRVHPSSIVDRHVELHHDVEIGPFCHVHAGVCIGEGTRLVSHVVVLGNTRIGSGNVFHPFSVIGGEAQVRKGPSSTWGSAPNPAPLRGLATNPRPTSRRGDPSARDRPSPRDDDRKERRGAGLEIADHNVFRESVTVSVSAGNGTTSIGSHNLFMAGSHVAHDVSVGSRCVIANAVQLAGHVVVEDWVTFGGLAGIAQHLCVGQGAFVAAGAMCERDVPPFVIVQGDRARVRALNVVGLERRDAPEASIAALREAFSRLWGSSSAKKSLGGFDECTRALDRSGSDPWVAILIDWLSDPLRRIRPAKRHIG